MVGGDATAKLPTAAPMARETLTAEKNIEAAVSLLDTDGLDGFNMRTVGAQWRVGSEGQLVRGRAAVLDDIDPHEGDAAWRAYTTRPDAPDKYKDMPRPAADWDLYVHQRTLLERHASANSENLWNGRPISLIVLAEPLDVLDGTPVSLIELIPPVHQRVYRTGLEHLGVVVGEDIDDFSRVHRGALTGQQFQSPGVEPVYVLFEDFTHVKFYKRSLYDGVILEGARFDGFSHVDDWVPQRLVTATGPNPLPR